MLFPAILVILLGLILGSFFTALVHRLYRAETLGGRSQCPECHHVLSVKDLIPVLSFLFLKGKCRYCGKKISLYYPLVELGTALYFLVGYLVYGLTLAYLAYLLIASLLFLILVFDWRYGVIPDALSLPAILVGFFLSLWAGESWLSLLAAGLFGFSFFAAQYFLSRKKWVGEGDLRMGGLMGVLLGLTYLWLGLMLAYLAGAAVAIFLLAVKKKTLKSPIPFGPFLVAATWVTMLWGQQILAWYWQLLR